MTSLNDKLVIVTGGSSGIGQALARQLAVKGAHVHIWARREALLQETLSTLGGNGEHAYAVVDVSKRDQVEAALENVHEVAGISDIIINNAGISYPGYIEDIPIETFEEIMAVNYLGAVYLTQLALPKMLERGSGHILNISSTAGFIGAFGYSAYGASKFAIRGYSDVLRSEMKYRGIRVSLALPPETDTPMLEEENTLKPFETSEIASSAGVLSAEFVAKKILNGIEKNRYLILPGFSNRFFFSLTNLMGGGVYPLMDFLVGQAIKKKNAKN